jgi:hypothetical protein
MLYDPNWELPETEIKIEPWQQILLDAADLIDTKGWIKGHLHTTNGFCVVGALQEANRGADGLSGYNEAHARLYQFVGRNPMEWNDTVCLNQKFVVKTLRTVADVTPPKPIVIDSRSWTGRY